MIQHINTPLLLQECMPSSWLGAHLELSPQLADAPLRLTQDHCTLSGQESIVHGLYLPPPHPDMCGCAFKEFCGWPPCGWGPSKGLIDSQEL
ncbi:hypothetical protein DPEC_G00196090 [Dallia pectoralis]|uniref:Uncharacterized protein n=1 Tax=Dallia pectoralis TaxID=75939 RepID=A0ACC2G7V7_DALPE|nr:hypothetical protein DPEC_G00196090 [Dallia pectoralis]